MSYLIIHFVEVYVIYILFVEICEYYKFLKVETFHKLIVTYRIFCVMIIGCHCFRAQTLTFLLYKMRLNLFFEVIILRKKKVISILDEKRVE